jgi:hypothetical protein
MQASPPQDPASGFLPQITPRPNPAIAKSISRKLITIVAMVCLLSYYVVAKPPGHHFA